MLFKKLLDKISKKSSNGPELDFEQFNLDQNQIKILMCLAEEKNDEMISLYEWTSIINEHFEYPERINVIKSLWAVAHADNTIDKYEDYTIRKIADLLYVRHEDFIIAKHQ